MNKVLLTITIFLLLSSCNICFSQNKFLTGVITLAGQPVNKLTVYTSFGTTTTDNLGRYSLSLNGCSQCRLGEKIGIYTYNQEFGPSAQTYTISSDQTFNFTIERNPSMSLISGMVQNSADGQALPNMYVAVIGLEYEMAPVKTNAFGEFKLFVRKEYLTNKNAVLLQVSDSSKKYRPVRAEPELFIINSFSTIKMRPNVSYSVQISGFSHTRICVNAGDAISIDASGTIKIGTLTGSSDPDGRSSGVLGFTLEPYNLVKEFNHAVLMYKFEGDETWKVAGKKKRFIAIKSGCLEFEINDNTQNDNSGHYDVEVSIQSATD